MYLQISLPVPQPGLWTHGDWFVRYGIPTKKLVWAVGVMGVLWAIHLHFTPLMTRRGAHTKARHCSCNYLKCLDKLRTEHVPAILPLAAIVDYEQNHEFGSKPHRKIRLSLRLGYLMHRLTCCTALSAKNQDQFSSFDKAGVYFRIQFFFTQPYHTVEECLILPSHLSFSPSFRSKVS